MISYFITLIPCSLYEILYYFRSHRMRTIATVTSVTQLYCANTVELIEVLFGDPRNHKTGVPISHIDSMRPSPNYSDHLLVIRDYFLKLSTHIFRTRRTSAAASTHHWSRGVRSSCIILFIVSSGRLSGTDSWRSVEGAVHTLTTVSRFTWRSMTSHRESQLWQHLWPQRLHANSNTHSVQTFSNIWYTFSSDRKSDH